ncbi:peptidase E [Psychrobacillus sp. NEAU-3TGS]|uniref:Type 1 glutamine amidotransferase-like domain-containing protein n=1 Tax=Psychrobacillus sp. NEAU-3TGS TaxID=2995412 RepID=UPI00249999D0|nr:peptidase E [Psychrobacillus sp. NEAU-3TGS]MDI2587177.1 peptidase E [Psychrobacillus sp. NEAU-3TGS]
MRQIIAMGGGGFSMEPENPLLDRYILQQSTKKRPKICFIGTASGDADSYIDKFYQFFRQEECEPTHFSLFKPSTRDIKKFIMEQDILYVGGGNTKNLMVLWKEWELDKAIREAYNNGTILSGISAGSLCWFEEGVTDSYGDELEPISCLGLISGSNCPHYDGEADRRPMYQKFIGQDIIGAGYAADDGVALHFTDEKLSKVVSSRPQAHGYYVDKGLETKLSTMYLGKEEINGDNKM